MNRRDDCAENCFHTGFSDRAEYQSVFQREENSVWKQIEGKRGNAKYGVFTVCIAGGMGAAGLFEVV